jgi:sugar/nucleoside kinase (ribokinase family)
MAKVASLGVHIADILGRPVSEIPSGQNISILEEIRITVAGTAAGTSVDLAKLGMDVYTIGALGQDELGDFVVDSMKRHGIHTEGLARKKGVQTSARRRRSRSPDPQRSCRGPVRGCSEHLARDGDPPAGAERLR